MPEIICDYKTLATLKHSWERLTAQAQSPFCSYEWTVAAAKSFYPPDSLRVVVTQTGGKVDAIAPLVVCNQKRFKHLEIAGASALDEPSVLLYAHEEVLPNLVKALVRMKLPVYLNKTVTAAPVAAQLRALARKYFSVMIARAAAPTAFVPIEGSWDEFCRSLTSRRRYDLKRAMKRANAFGEVKADVFAPRPEALETALDKAFNVEAAGWKGRGGSALCQNRPLGNFFRTYTKSACAQGILRLGFLYIDGKSVAMLIGLECHNRFWVLKVGYDEAYSRCSPGILLINASIQYAFEQKLCSYEFLGSDEQWLHMWARGNRRNHVSFGLFPPGLAGWGTLGRDVARWGAAKFRSRNAGKN